MRFLVAGGVALFWLVVGGCDAYQPTRSGESPMPPPGVDLLPNGHFDEVSAPWAEYFGLGASGTSGLDDGRLCLTVSAPGSNEWDAQLRARGVKLVKGHIITVRLSASATPAARLSVKLAMQAAPYTTYWQRFLEATPDATELVGTFTMSSPSDATAELAVMVGGALPRALPTTICIDDVSVQDPEASPSDQDREPDASVVHVNQVGFRRDASKLGVLVNATGEAREFSLVAGDGSVVFHGTSEPRGLDPASGDNVDWLDFSAFAEPCEPCRLEVSGARSAPFRVADDALSALASSALAYFYYNRSGVPISMPYAGDAKWARPAGHLADAKVTCHPDLERLSPEDQAHLRGNLLTAAELYLDVAEREGYRLPYAAGQDGRYLWGSNVVVLSNALVCAYAFDLSGDRRYLRGVEDALDYVLGRNALDRSYVTGFGTRPLRYPHHRFWAHAARPERPPPPPGAMVSGANSALADPAVRAGVPSHGPPQRCYVDDIEAYSVNEVAVHQNAALAWVAAYLDSVRRAR